MAVARSNAIDFGPAMADAQHEVLIVRFGIRTTTRSDVFLNYHVYGEPDGPVGMDYFFWVVQGEGGPVIVDTGFSRAASESRHRTMLVDPRDALADLGIDPADGPPVIVTHAHWDHIGNLGHFARSPVIVARTETEFWAGPHSRHPLFRHAAEESELETLAQVVSDGRAVLFDDRHEVAPGIRVVRTGGHTPGQSVVLVQTAAGLVVIASDAVHYYEEMDRDMPFSAVSSLPDMYETFAGLKRLVSGGQAAQVVTGHDPSTLDLFGAADGPAGAKMAVVGRPA